MLSHTHLGTCGSGSGIVCHFVFQENSKTKDEASNATKTQMSPRSQHKARTAIYQQLPLGTATDPMTNPTLGLSSASCHSGPRALSKQSFRTLGEGTLAPSQGFAGRKLEGQRDGEEEAALQANRRQSGKLPETPAQTAERAWLIHRGPYDLMKARPGAAGFQKLGELMARISAPLCSYWHLKGRHWDGAGSSDQTSRGLGEGRRLRAFRS